MRKILATVLVALAAITCASSANAQLRFGVKAGINVNSMHFSSDLFDAHNRAGFTGGVMMEFTAPVSGLGLDLSLMYTRRNAKWMENEELINDNRDYISLPLHFKWRINIPLVNKIVRPYLLTGPDFAVLTSGRAVKEGIRNRKFDTSWDFGFGVELFQHLQVGASYGIGMTKALKAVGVTGAGDVAGRNRYWTVTAAYLF
ncbi:MAG: PorT family protein [Muribaculaceae bacterium]|nr:PorT family protein [Muribaculaceae bacterium]